MEDFSESTLPYLRFIAGPERGILRLVQLEIRGQNARDAGGGRYFIQRA